MAMNFLPTKLVVKRNQEVYKRHLKWSTIIFCLNVSTIGMLKVNFEVDHYDLFQMLTPVLQCTVLTRK